MKKGLIITGILIVIGAIAAGAWYFLSKTPGNTAQGKDSVYVDSVAMLAGLDSGGIGLQNRYSGIVEAQDTLEVRKDGSKTIKELYVSEGDMVEEGTPLFSYDVAELRLSLEQGNLELDRMANSIASLKSQIAELEKEREKAGESDKLGYTTQIQQLQTNIKQEEYNQKTKKLELERTKASIENSEVVSTMKGVVRTINENGMDMYGNESAYITIMASGEYRVKGTINEQNAYQLPIGESVIIRSRVDSEKTWSGTISSLGTEPETDNNNGMWGGGMMGGETETTSKYPFYIALDSHDGLMIGQHVFIELNVGQEDKKEGIWLYQDYIVRDGDNAFVWAASKKDTLEKRPVTLGAFDEAMMTYEILEGLSEDDYIAWPQEGMEEGTGIIKNEPGMMGGGMNGAILPDGGGDMLLPEDGGMIDSGVALPEDGGTFEGSIALPEVAE